MEENSPAVDEIAKKKGEGRHRHNESIESTTRIGKGKRRRQNESLVSEASAMVNDEGRGTKLAHAQWTGAWRVTEFISPGQSYVVLM